MMRIIDKSSSQSPLRPKPRPARIRVITPHTFKQFLDDSISSRIVSPGIERMPGLSSSDLPSPMSTRTWDSSNPSTPSTPQFLSVKYHARTTGNDDDDDDDDDDDLDFTPPVTPRAFGVAEHVRIANGSGNDSSYPYPGTPHPPQFHYHYDPIECGYDSGFDIDSSTSSCTTSRFSDIDLSIESLSVATDSEPEPKVEALPTPIEYTQLGSPDFTNPFEKNKPLKQLPRLLQKDYKPLPKKFLKSITRLHLEPKGLGEGRSTTLLWRSSVKSTAKSRLAEGFGHLPLPSPVQHELSPYDRKGMSPSERRMLRLMRELFADIAMAGAERPRSEGDTHKRSARIPKVHSGLSPMLPYLTGMEELCSEQQQVTKSDGRYHEG